MSVVDADDMCQPSDYVSPVQPSPPSCEPTTMSVVDADDMCQPSDYVSPVTAILPSGVQPSPPSSEPTTMRIVPSDDVGVGQGGKPQHPGIGSGIDELTVISVIPLE